VAASLVHKRAHCGQRGLHHSLVATALLNKCEGLGLCSPCSHLVPTSVFGLCRQPCLVATALLNECKGLRSPCGCLMTTLVVGLLSGASGSSLLAGSSGLLGEELVASSWRARAIALDTRAASWQARAAAASWRARAASGQRCSLANASCRRRLSALSAEAFSRAAAACRRCSSASAARKQQSCLYRRRSRAASHCCRREVWRASRMWRGRQRSHRKMVQAAARSRAWALRSANRWSLVTHRAKRRLAKSRPAPWSSATHWATRRVVYSSPSSFCLSRSCWRQASSYRAQAAAASWRSRAAWWCRAHADSTTLSRVHFQTMYSPSVAPLWYSVIGRPPAAGFYCINVSLAPVSTPKGGATPVTIVASSPHGLRNRHARTSRIGKVRATIWGSQATNLLWGHAWEAAPI
jgi:hypothetical protein